MIRGMKSRIEHLITRDVRELVAPITKEGIELREVSSEGFGGHVSAKEFQDSERPEVFTPSTVIISGGYGLWELEVPENLRKRLVDMTLRIETIRMHGMLHMPPYELEVEDKEYRRRASIIVNGQLVDRISLVKPHPHGEDYGVDSRRPFPVFCYIHKDRSI